MYYSIYCKIGRLTWHIFLLKIVVGQEINIILIHMPKNICVVYTCTNKKPHELYQVLHFKDLWLTIIKFTHICVLKYILSENDIGFGSIFVCVGHIDVHGPVSYTRSTHLGACREDNIYSNKYNSCSLIFSNHIFFFNSEIRFVKK